MLIEKASFDHTLVYSHKHGTFGVLPLVLTQLAGTSITYHMCKLTLWDLNFKDFSVVLWFPT